MKTLSSVLFVVALFVLLMTFSGCGFQTDEEWFCSEHRCEDTTSFAAIPELDAYAAAAIVRLNKATGGTLRQDIKGLPVFYQEHLVTDGKEDCGHTETIGLPGKRKFAQRILIDPTPPEGCPPIHVCLLHEMIHALVPELPHSDDGVFANPVSGSRLTEADLVQLCGTFYCSVFIPEAP